MDDSIYEAIKKDLVEKHSYEAGLPNLVRPPGAPAAMPRAEVKVPHRRVRN
jgi:hypothetical protein